MEGVDILVGTRLFLTEKGVAITPEQEYSIAELEKQGNTVILCSYKGTFIGKHHYFQMQDSCRNIDIFLKVI